MNSPSGFSVFDVMVQFFKEDDWKYRQIPDKPILSLGYQGSNGSWTCYAQAREEQKQVVFYSKLDVNAPADKRSAIAEFITRANYGLIIGNFELDFNDGEIRFKTSLDVKDNESKLSTGLIKRLVYINVILMDRYLPGIMSVIYAGVSPADAIKKIES